MGVAVAPVASLRLAGTETNTSRQSSANMPVERVYLDPQLI